MIRQLTENEEACPSPSECLGKVGVQAGISSFVLKRRLAFKAVIHNNRLNSKT
jgi:hypothetical protein